ncbi:pheromone-binding protein [Papilio machaon]|uniref:pheromone-binding protein n=1 Tax=Papilio machaon TaxID=76193 RepID=UPI001E66467C|nr:pheromone-binding protein [Papilio machaon]
MDKKIIFVVIVCMLTCKTVYSSQEIIQTMSINYMKGLDTCKSELNLPDVVDIEFAQFWREDYIINNRLTGCAIVCLSSKLDLLEPDGSLHHGNAANFAKKHGADEAMAQQLIDILHQCEQQYPDKMDACLHALKVCNCFKTQIHKLNWAPDVELIVGEVLAEI